MQHASCSWRSLVLTEEQTSPGAQRPLQNGGGKKSKANLEAGAGDILFPLDATSACDAVLLTKEAALGKNSFVFSQEDQLGPLSSLSPTGCGAVSFDSQRPCSNRLLSLPVSRDQFLLLAKNRGAICQEQKIKRGGQLLEREGSSRIRLAVTNSPFKADPIMAHLRMGPAQRRSRHHSCRGPSCCLLPSGQGIARGSSDAFCLVQLQNQVFSI